jgi:CheY-like chemotaxis protein
MLQANAQTGTISQIRHEPHEPLMIEPVPRDVPDAPLQVLLLDDDPFMLSLMQDMLEALGQLDVRCETDARRALLSLNDLAPDLLICDLSMPDMDGIEFLKAAAGGGFRGKVMLLSGVDAGVRRSAERLARAQGLAVVGAFQKPISAQELGAALAALRADAPPDDDNLYNLATRSGK